MTDSRIMSPADRAESKRRVEQIIGPPMPRILDYERGVTALIYVTRRIDARSLPISEAIENGLRSYAIDRRPTGDFLRAVLENDLTNAACHADTRNQLQLAAIVSWCCNHLPGNCWGSPERVRVWLAWETL